MDASILGNAGVGTTTSSTTTRPGYDPAYFPSVIATRNAGNAALADYKRRFSPLSDAILGQKYSYTDAAQQASERSDAAFAGMPGMLERRRGGLGAVALDGQLASEERRTSLARAVASADAQNRAIQNNKSLRDQIAGYAGDLYMQDTAQADTLLSGLSKAEFDREQTYQQATDASKTNAANNKAGLLGAVGQVGGTLVGAYFNGTLGKAWDKISGWLGSGKLTPEMTSAIEAAKSQMMADAMSGADMSNVTLEQYLGSDKYAEIEQQIQDGLNSGETTGSTETGSTETGSTETGSTETGSTGTGGAETGSTGSGLSTAVVGGSAAAAAAAAASRAAGRTGGAIIETENGEWVNGPDWARTGNGGTNTNSSNTSSSASNTVADAVGTGGANLLGAAASGATRTGGALLTGMDGEVLGGADWLVNGASGAGSTASGAAGGAASGGLTAARAASATNPLGLSKVGNAGLSMAAGMLGQHIWGGGEGAAGTLVNLAGAALGPVGAFLAPLVGSVAFGPQKDSIQNPITGQMIDRQDPNYDLVAQFLAPTTAAVSMNQNQPMSVEQTLQFMDAVERGENPYTPGSLGDDVNKMVQNRMSISDLVKAYISNGGSVDSLLPQFRSLADG